MTPFALAAAWTVGETEEAAFPAIEYDAPGDYYYLIGEIDDGQAGVVYDKARYLAHVAVAAGADGSLAAGVPEFRMAYPGASGGWDDLGAADGATFVNNSGFRLASRSFSAAGYAPAAERVSAYPEVLKTVDGGAGSMAPGEFSFELRDAGGALVATAANDAAGRVAFFGEGGIEGWGLVYDGPGTWTYAITEVAGDDPAVTYDDSVITLTVAVSREDPSDPASPLKAELAYSDESGAALSEPTFDNAREGIDLVVYKVSRSGGEGLEGCTYALWLHGGSGDVMVQEATSGARGRIVFRDAPLVPGALYYFKEVEAPSGHTVDPYRTAYFALSEDGTSTVLAEDVADDGWHSKYDNIDLDRE